MRSKPSALPTLVIAIALASIAADAGAHVLCRKGNRLKLRPTACTGREVRVPLDAETLGGKTIEEIVAPLEARIDALEAALVTTSTVSSTTTTTTLGPGRLTCSCNDDTVFTPCLPSIDCRLYGDVSQACADLCQDHGGPCEFVPGCALSLTCDNDDPSCQM